MTCVDRRGIATEEGGARLPPAPPCGWERRASAMNPLASQPEGRGGGGRRASTATSLPFTEGRGVDHSNCSSSSSESDGALKQRPSGELPWGREGPDPGDGANGEALGFRDLELEGCEGERGWPPASGCPPSGLGAAEGRRVGRSFQFPLCPTLSHTLKKTAFTASHLSQITSDIGLRSSFTLARS